MSQSFSVRGRRFSKPLTLQEVLSLADLSLLDDDTVEHPERMAKPLPSDPTYVSGSLRGRGFGVFAHARDYVVRVNTPATSEDWQEALLLLRRLSETFGSPVIDENGRSWSPAEITGFDYRQDIRAGIHAMAEQARSEGSMTIGGAVRFVTLDADGWGRIISAPDPVAAFDALLADLQQIDAYDPRPLLARDEDGGIVAVYALTEGVPTIMPLRPSLRRDYGYPEEPRRWEVALARYEDEEAKLAARIPFETFWGNLSPAAVRPMDAASVVVTLDRPTIDRLVAGA